MKMNIDKEKIKGTVYQIIGAAMEVHNELRWGLLEPIYNEALHLELLDRGIENESEKYLPCFYKHHQLEKYYKMDLVVGEVVVELKSVSELVPAHRTQLFNYMRLTKKSVGLLINFGQPSLQGERYLYSEAANECFMVDKDMRRLDDIYEKFMLIHE